MNASSNSTSEFIQENDGDSESDTNSEGLPEYYEPISTEADEESSEDHSDSNELNFHRPSNGHAVHCLENGVTSIDLCDEEENGEKSDKEEEAEEARMREVVRAFREDEQRRNAPLTVENSTRVMEAMRGISFVGTAPNWANRVPEDEWIHQIRGIRRSSPRSTTSTSSRLNT